MTDHDTDGEFEALLGFLKENRGFDFTGYKRASLMRRVRRRMETIGLSEFGEYIDHLRVHPGEFELLFDTILINVTEFFRDPQTWESLAERFVPKILAEKAADQPIRVWSAGCATGEEPYSLAILFAEAMGMEAFRQRVKIYASDLDADALSFARQALYPAKRVENVPAPLLDKYFVPRPGHFQVQPELRRAVLFGPHNLVEDAPISHLDLLSCRNTLMYFNSDAQSRIMARFHFALRPGGILVFGRAEMMRSYDQLFRPLDIRARVFEALGGSKRRDHLLMGGRNAPHRVTPTTQPSRALRLREAALNAARTAQIVIDRDGVVALINAAARALFGLTDRDLGTPLQDLRISYVPVELRSYVGQAMAEGRPVTLEDIDARRADGRALSLDLQVVPLFDEGGEPLGASATFADVTRHRSVQLELQRANEELETMNDELSERTGELAQANRDLRAILKCLQLAVIVVDPDLRIRVWSQKAHDQWGLRADEVEGESLVNLDSGLPADQLVGPIRSCLHGGPAPELQLDVIDRRGRPVRSRIQFSALSEGDEIAGVVILIDARPREAREQAVG